MAEEKSPAEVRKMRNKQNRSSILLHPVNSCFTFLLKMEIAYR